MPYQHDQDIDPEYAFDCAELDKRLNVLCLRSEEAVRRSKYGAGGDNLLSQYASLFLQTHRSVRALSRTSFKHDGMAGDAMSLVREQLEKVFGMALFVEDFPKWSERLFIDGWSRAYEAFLLEAKEYQRLPRFAPYYTKEGAEEMEALRVQSGAPAELKEYLELQSAGKNTDHVKGYKPSKYRFPSPSNAMKEIQDPARRASLERWYAEYETACSFAHVLIQKIVVASVQLNSRDELIERRNMVLTKHIEHALVLSYTATAYALTDLNALLGYDHPVLEASNSMWDVLRDASMLGRAVWDLHAKNLMPGSGLIL